MKTSRKSKRKRRGGKKRKKVRKGARVSYIQNSRDKAKLRDVTKADSGRSVEVVQVESLPLGKIREVGYVGCNMQIWTLRVLCRGDISESSPLPSATASMVALRGFRPILSQVELSVAFREEGGDRFHRSIPLLDRVVSRCYPRLSFRLV